MGLYLFVAGQPDAYDSITLTTTKDILPDILFHDLAGVIPATYSFLITAALDNSSTIMSC